VVLAGKRERRLDACTVDLDERCLGVFLDDREQVAEQAAIGLGQRVRRGARRRGSRRRRRSATATAALDGV
jgi:hypothetical protein